MTTLPTLPPASSPVYGGLFREPSYGDGKPWADAVADQDDTDDDGLEAA